MPNLVTFLRKFWWPPNKKRTLKKITCLFLYIHTILPSLFRSLTHTHTHTHTHIGSILVGLQWLLCQAIPSNLHAWLTQAVLGTSPATHSRWLPGAIWCYLQSPRPQSLGGPKWQHICLRHIPLARGRRLSWGIPVLPRETRTCVCQVTTPSTDLSAQQHTCCRTGRVLCHQLPLIKLVSTEGVGLCHQPSSNVYTVLQWQDRRSKGSLEWITWTQWNSTVYQWKVHV